MLKTFHDAKITYYFQLSFFFLDFFSYFCTLNVFFTDLYINEKDYLSSPYVGFDSYG